MRSYNSPTPLNLEQEQNDYQKLRIPVNMNDAALYESWFLWLGVATVLIIAAATLVLLVNAAARRILRLALTALDLVVEIRKNTDSIWGLQQTNEVAGKILKESGEIKAHLTLVSDALHDLDSKK